MGRQEKGLIGFSSLTAGLMTISALIFNFSLLSLVIPAILVFVFMCGREIYQYKTKQAEKFEWDDIATYGVTIGFVAVAYIMIVAAINGSSF